MAGLVAPAGPKPLRRGEGPAIHAFLPARRGCPAAQTSLRSLRKLDCGPGMPRKDAHKCASRRTRPKTPAPKRYFHKRNQADLGCPVPRAKIFNFCFSEIYGCLRSSRARTEGRFAIVTDVGRGMRRTSRHRPTSDCRCGRQRRVVLAPRRWGQVALRAATVARKPGHRGEHAISRKTVVQGMPDRSGVPVVTNSYAFCLHTRLRVRRSTGIPCALGFRKALLSSKTRALRAAG